MQQRQPVSGRIAADTRSRLGSVVGGLQAAVGKYVFTASLVGLAFLFTYANSEVEITGDELRGIVLWCLTVHSVLVFTTLLVFRPGTLTAILVGTGYRSLAGGGLAGPRCARLCNVVLALVVVAGVTTVYTVHTQTWLTGSRVLVVLGSLATGIGVFAALQFIDEVRWVRTTLPLVAMSVLALTASQYLGHRDLVERNYESQVRSITFEETPNLYFISFDALSPKAVMKEHLDIDTTDFVELIDAEFRRLPNFFADSIWSRSSFNTTMALDPDIFWSAYHETGWPGPGYVIGHSPSPLLDILRHNGYETNLVYRDLYFGREKGPYLDHFETIEPARTVCGLMDQSLVVVAFWGYCNLFSADPGPDYGRFAAELPVQLDAITRIANRQRPQFVLSYTRVPLHTRRTYDHSDPRDRETYRDEYIKKSSWAVSYAAGIIDVLREHDPDALLFVFGDHGANLSRGLDFADDPEFVVKDSYAVLGGIWPRDACEPWFDETLEQEFLTILDAVHTILRCLSGGEEALVEPRDRLLRNGRGRIPDDGVERSFADYLYE